MRVEKKKELVSQLKEKFKEAKVVIVTDYKGLNVAAMNELRSKLKEADIEYRVVKNTLLRRAAEETDVAAIADAFVGPSAVALSYEDPVSPAKVLTAFAKGNDKLEIKVGVMGESVLDLQRIKALSSLPGREVLLSQTLSAMNAVPTGLVTVLSGIPKKLLYLLQALKDQKEAA